MSRMSKERGDLVTSNVYCALLSDPDIAYFTLLHLGHFT